MVGEKGCVREVDAAALFERMARGNAGGGCRVIELPGYRGTHPATRKPGNPKPMFITFEGIDGSGKTTQLRRVAERVDNPLITKEPGGTPTADRIRAILLDQGSKLDPLAEVLLFAASRHQHVVEVIRPALEAGRVVL